VTTDHLPTTGALGQQFTRETILADYRTAYRSRQVSILGRKEVMTGKAKFGIFGDGKELAQLAMARAFRAGDFRSGYYRDQTFMFASDMLTVEQYFAQLYADTDVEREPNSAGRQMNAHFASRLLDEEGNWRSQSDRKNSSADLSPTGSQMPRLVGLAYASRLYRQLPELQQMTQFSRQGNEVVFGTIGNATCAEGMLWEAINAVGVVQAPMVLSIWDDGYGISVPNEYQITKGDISEILQGFQRDAGSMRGFDIYTVRGWDYAALCETYLHATEIVRADHVPAIIHVAEMTQPLGHSTSGSHERYKSTERLAWEEEFDPIRKMREWMMNQGIAAAEELDRLEVEERQYVREAQRRAWDAYRAPIELEMKTFVELADAVARQSSRAEELRKITAEVQRAQTPLRRDILRAALDALILVRDENTEASEELARWRRDQDLINTTRYGSDLYSDSAESALAVEEVKPVFGEDSPVVNGFEIINACFDAAMRRHPNLFIMGEDVGRLGDVNQGCAGLQQKYGELRVFDTGIRECTILGQAIGMALRGLRPIAEVQYLDYLLYALQILSDDLATLRWRTKGGQKAPVIIRTRGHRLEGVWHSGSPMAGVISLLRGIYVCVPRNMTQAAGFYNTMLRSDDPALIIEVLNGYRVKERRPSNMSEFTVPLGVPEILRRGTDVTVVTYGACCRIALEAAEMLSSLGVDVELIDVQTLVPFDTGAVIGESLRKTNRVVFVDEDVPGGATAYMMQQVLEAQGGYEWLDSEPRTVPGKPHRPAYGSDGDYWSKPSREQIFEAVYELIHESDPGRYPLFYR